MVPEEELISLTVLVAPNYYLAVRVPRHLPFLMETFFKVYFL
jgi:hypothetical protein